MDSIIHKETIPLLQATIFDENNENIANIEYSVRGYIHTIKTPEYINTAGVAENREELIACFNSEGNFTHSSTRKEAREYNERYLVVTNIIHHVNNKGETEVLLQQRSMNKKIDPGKFSASAHGVGKQLFFSDGNKMQNLEYSALINSALEINEELRHGSQPFSISIRYDGVPKLKEYFKQNKVNDDNTIYLVPIGLYSVITNVQEL